MTETDPYLTLVVPFYREGRGATQFIERLCSFLSTNEATADKLVEIIAVVDHYPYDDTFQLIREMRGSVSVDLKGVLLSPRVGHQESILAGMLRAGGKNIICMDGDFQHPVEVIPEMLKLAEEGAPVVLTERLAREGESFWTEITSKFFYYIFRLLSKVELRSGESDFRLISRDILEIWIDNFPEVKQFHRAIFRSLVPEAPVVKYLSPARSTGGSKFNFLSRLLLLLNSITSFSKALLFIPTIFALFFLFLTVFLAIIALHDFFTVGLPLGWLSLFLMISLSNTAIFFAISILSQYISVIFDEIKSRAPRRPYDEF